MATAHWSEILRISDLRKRAAFNLSKHESGHEQGYNDIEIELDSVFNCGQESRIRCGVARFGERKSS
eukprot:1368691-Amorphochlora_amoeboformis.AAC.1